MDKIQECWESEIGKLCAGTKVVIAAGSDLIEGRFVGYDPLNDAVYVERQDKNTVTVIRVRDIDVVLLSL
ncbi:MAG: hypothetical protein ABWK05_07175 [Pyrobaculum sp.]